MDGLNTGASDDKGLNSGAAQERGLNSGAAEDKGLPIDNITAIRELYLLLRCKKAIENGTMGQPPQELK